MSLAYLKSVEDSKPPGSSRVFLAMLKFNQFLAADRDTITSDTKPYIDNPRVDDYVAPHLRYSDLALLLPLRFLLGCLAFGSRQLLSFEPPNPATSISVLGPNIEISA
jgi:hypothetical protein